MQREGRQEVRSQVRGGDNDELCFSAAPDGNQEKGGKAARVAVDRQATFTTILKVSNNLKIVLIFFKLSPHDPLLWKICNLT